MVGHVYAYRSPRSPRFCRAPRLVSSTLSNPDGHANALNHDPITHHMAPKNKGKAAAGSGDAKDNSKSKLKPATSINVRHILCEKHAKKEEALEKLRNGAKFDEVAREMSEDKARQGMS
jgi:hypothetical protein